MPHISPSRPMLSVVIVLASVGAGNPIASVDSSGWDDWDDTTTYSPEIDKGLPKMSSEDKQFLAQTWAYCFNDEIRERDKCIQKLEAFLERVPDTPFRAEIYFRIGYMYGPARNDRLGEQYDARKMCEYFKKAVEEYDGRYCGLLCTAWGSLMSAPDTSLSEKKEYYAWLLKMDESMTVDDLFPYRSVGNYLKGFPGRFSQSEMERSLELVRRGSLRDHTHVAGIAIMESSTPDQLLELARTFPGTALAQKCMELRARHDKAMAQSLTDLVDTEEDAVDIQSASTDIADESSHESESASSSNEIPSSDKRPSGNVSRGAIASAALIIILLLACGTLWWHFSLRRR